jgi:hypothetical protein
MVLDAYKFKVAVVIISALLIYEVLAMYADSPIFKLPPTPTPPATRRAPELTDVDGAVPLTIILIVAVINCGTRVHACVPVLNEYATPLSTVVCPSVGDSGKLMCFILMRLAPLLH